MALIEKELDVIRQYVPQNAAEGVLHYLHLYKIHLIIRRERKSILGDYRPAHKGKPHTISVNGNLNSYHFLITFIHEVAHLVTYIAHGRKALPHGSEWKSTYSKLLYEFIQKKIFPLDIEMALFASINNPSASTCSEPHLYRILRQHDTDKPTVMVEKLPVGSLFRTDNGQLFRIETKKRTRYECLEINTNKRFLFPGIYEVYKE